MNAKKNNIYISITKLVEKINIIDNLNIPIKLKNKIYIKIAKTFKKNIKHNITINSYNTYITLARKPFLNIKHYNYQKNIDHIYDMTKYFKKTIYKLKILPIDIINTEIQYLINKLNQINKLQTQLNNTNICNHSIIYKKTYLTLIKKFPAWKQELLNIIYPNNWFNKIKKFIFILKDGQKILPLIKKIKITHTMLSYLKLNKKKYLFLQKQSLNKLLSKKQKTIYINYINYLNKIHNILYVINQIYYIKEFSILAYCLSAVSGRRMIEILQTGIFTYRNSYQLYFTGAAKTKYSNKKYCIYILCDTNIFLEKLKLLRNSIIFKTTHQKIYKNKEQYQSINSKINIYFAKIFNNWVKKFFNDNHRTYKDSRSIYARIIYKKYFQTDKKWKYVDEDIFFYKNLCHKNIHSQLYYKQFKLLNFNINWKPHKVYTDIRLITLNTLNNKIPQNIKLHTWNKIHNTTKNIIIKHPLNKINNYALRKYGFNYKLIRMYLVHINKYITLNHNYFLNNITNINKYINDEL